MTLAGVAAQISSETDTEVVAVAAASVARIGHVVVTADTGATTTLVNGWTYNTEGSISTAVPSSGQVGTLVTISGSSLRGSGNSVASATLNGYSARVVSQNDSTVVLEAGDGDIARTTGDIVLMADSGAVVRGANKWTYIVPGVISSVSPSQGRVGTLVTIVGSSLCGGGTNLASLSLSNFEADIVENNCGVAKVRARDYGANFVGDGVLTSNTGARVTNTNSWAYIAADSITSASPAAGQDWALVTMGLFGGGSA